MSEKEREGEIAHDLIFQHKPVLLKQSKSHVMSRAAQARSRSDLYPVSKLVSARHHTLRLSLHSESATLGIFTYLRKYYSGKTVLSSGFE